MRFQFFVEDQYGREWATLKREMVLPDGRVVKTKILPDGRLQYVRRTGDIGISADEYQGGEPHGGQWRIHPSDAQPARPVFSRAQPQKIPPKPLPDGIVFE